MKNLQNNELSSDDIHNNYMDAAPVAKIRVEDVFKKTNNILKLAYDEVPYECLQGSKLNLEMWSLIIKDSCLIKIAERSNNQKESTRIELGEQKNLETSMISIAQQMKQKPVTELLIPGAELISDKGLIPIIKSCPSIEKLNISKASKITDNCIWKLAETYPNLKFLNIAYVIRASNAGLAMVGQNCVQLEYLNLTGCKNAPEWVLLRIAYGCQKLKVLDLSFCPKVSDQVLKVIGKSCQYLESITLKGCRQVSDTGLLSLADGCRGLVHVDLTRWDFQYKITDMGILALSEKCKFLQAGIFNGCEFLSDVSLNWLANGCCGITQLEFWKCDQITDIGLRSIGENLPKLRKLKLVNCSVVTDLGIRHIGNGCQELQYLDLQSMIHLSDGHCGNSSTIYDTESDKFGEKNPLNGLASIAAGCKNLKYLNISNCFRVKSFGLELIGKLCSLLKTISLKGCSQITQKSLLLFIQNSHHLEILSLEDVSNVNDQTLHKIAKSDMSSSLKSLNLRNCNLITNKGIQLIAHNCPKLTHLNVSQCYLLSDYALLALAEAQKYPGLRHLNLSFCTKFTESGISWIAERCPYILRLDLTRCSIKKGSLLAIQGSWKYSHFRHDRHFYGMIPNYRSEESLLIDEYGACWKAAIKIQSIYRARVATRIMTEHRKEALRNWAVKRLQSIYRGKKARQYALVMKMRKMSRENAAKKIQFYYRQYKNYCKEKQRLAEEHEKLMIEMATRVQCLWRQRKAKGEMLYRKMKKALRQELEEKCVKLIQRIWRGKQGRKLYQFHLAAKIAYEKERVAAACRIQTIYRGRHGQMEAAKKRQDKLEHEKQQIIAAQKIQAASRGRNARQLLKREKIEKEKVVKAALMIQKRWRQKCQMINYQFLKMANEYQKENNAALKLQTSWRRKKGQLALHLLRTVKDQEYMRRDQAARKLQCCWRIKAARDEYGNKKAEAFDRIVAKNNYVYMMATRIQTRWRGIKGREYYRKLIIDRKQRWKEIFDKEKQQYLYYNQDTGEIRYRMPQDMLDLLPKPKCNNCIKLNAVNECKDCDEFYCKKCFVDVHAGGKRKTHTFRTLYDYYDRRIDYGEGEWPSKWPTEIEQDEYTGWFLRISPYREPQNTLQHWEEYVDDESQLKWYYNRKTKESTYERPLVYLEEDGPEWVKYYDPNTHYDFYHNTRNGNTQFERPLNYESPRNENESNENLNLNVWSKHYDEDKSDCFYYNSSTKQSTYVRPNGFLTPREDQWEKFYDEETQQEYYYNHDNNQSTFERPINFDTPRKIWKKYYDDNTKMNFYYNIETEESTFTPPLSDDWLITSNDL